MANCRYLTSFTITSGSNDVLRMTINAVAEDITITAGTYYWSLDDDTTAGQKDFGEQLEEDLEAHSESANEDWTVEIYGVNKSSSSHADGRLYISNASDDWTWHFGHANTTIDPRIFGFATAAGDESSTSQAMSSDFVHRYGWYPQTNPAWYLIRESNRRSFVEYSTGGYVDGAQRSTTDYDYDARLDARPSALIRTDAATISARATSVNTSANDPNISLEAWAGDCQNTSAKWRFYPTITSYTTADFEGPYRFREGSYLWTRPADGHPDYPIGELWNRDIDGVTARG